ncbi:MAG: hypothetical protein LBQ28_10620 [Prevotellaceae bacterium]|jgi:hypothetical protein|nr:hypothetical protein [Prevotellaceae bacterium]
MKSNKLKTVLSIILLTILFTGCKKEYIVPNVGTVNISFANHPSYLGVEVFLAENTNVIIYSKAVSGLKVTIQLNVGNYIILPYALYPNSFNPITIQLTPGKTVNVFYDEDNVGHIR